MAKFLLIVFLFSFTLISFSQDGITIKVHGNNTDYSSNQGTYIINATQADLVGGKLVIDLEVGNNTAYAQNWNVTRLKANDVPSGWIDNMCLTPGVCYDPSNLNPWTTTNALPVAVSGTAQILFDIKPNSYTASNYILFLGDGNGNYEDSIKIQVNYALGIKENKQTTSFSMYPNPANENLIINIPNIDKGHLKIVDLLGNTVLTETIDSNSKIDVSEFKNGIYFITVDAEGVKFANRKLVVKH